MYLFNFSNNISHSNKQYFCLWVEVEYISTFLNYLVINNDDFVHQHR